MTFRHETAATTTTTEGARGGRKRNRLRVAVMAGALAVLPMAGLVTATTASAATVSTWDQVAQCESSGDWSINTGNGYYGGLQFSASTWDAYGGTQYAATADQATKAQQIDIAENVLASQGPGAWPVCSVQAGLTQGGSAADVDTSASSSTTQSSDSSSSSSSSTESSSDTGSSSTAAASGESYTVQSGDTLSAVAAANGTSTEALYAKNAQVIGDNPNLIYPGQVLSL